MRILILSQWYPPEPMKLLSDMAESLYAMGHDVTVLTGFPNWPEGKVYSGYKIKLLQKEVIGGVPIVRIPLYPNHSTSKIKRAFNYLSFIFSASLLGPFLIKPPDIIHAIQPPTTCFAAWFLSRIWKIPFTYEIQDMWPETLQATGMVNNKKILNIVSKCCNWVYSKASALRVISPGFRDNLISKGVALEKINLVPNWVDVNFYKPQPVSIKLSEKMGFKGQFNILYAGTVGLAQGLETILSAAALLQDLVDIRFVIAGDGVALSDLKGYIATHKINNVKFLGRQPMSLMPDLYALSDILLVHLKDDPLFRMTIPHKTLTYLAAGKPILAAVEGDVADILKSAQAGLVCPSDNPQALADTVRRFYNMSSAELGEMGKNGRRAACELYSRENLVGQLAQTFEVVVDKSMQESIHSATNIACGEKK